MKLDVMESELKNIHLRCRRRVVTASWINEPPRSKLPSAAQHCAVRLLWEGDEKRTMTFPKLHLQMDGRRFGGLGSRRSRHVSVQSWTALLSAIK